MGERQQGNLRLIMALDPTSQFGKLSAGPARAPKAAQIVPVDTVQSATLPALAMAKLGDNIADSLEVIRRGGITNDELTAKARYSEASSRAAAHRMDQQKIQMDSGSVWNAEQLETDYKQRLEKDRVELDKDYPLTWIGDKAAGYEQQWRSQEMESYTKGVIQPRIADTGRRNIEKISQNKQTEAATYASQGKLLEAMASLGDAAKAYEDGPAAFLFTPEQIAMRQNKVWSDGAMKTLAIQDPKRVVELVDSSMALRNAASAGDASQLEVDPLKGFSTAKLLDIKNDFTVFAKRQDEEKAREVHKQQVIEANGAQNELIMFMTDPKTSGSMINQRLIVQRAQLSDMLEKDPGNPMVDVLGRGVVQMTNELDQRARKAEASSKRAQSEGSGLAELGSFVSSGSKVDPTDAKSRKMGDGLYAQLQKQHNYDGLPEPQRMQFDASFVDRFGYLPEKRERDLKQRANSADENVARAAVNQLAALARIDPNVMGQLPKGMETIIHNVTRNGLTVEQARKGVADDQIRSPEEAAVIKDRIKSATDSTTMKPAPFAASKVLGSAFKGAQLPVQVEGQYKALFENSFKTNGQDPDAAAKDAKEQITRDFSVTKSDGKPVVRYKQPDKFGIKDDDLKYQQEKHLKGYVIKERGLDPASGQEVVKEHKLDGTENIQYQFVGTRGDKPVYRMNILDKRSGAPKPLIDARGPVEIEFDPTDKRPAPVAPPTAPGLAQRTGKTGNPLARAAASFSTPNNPAIGQK